MSNNRYSKYSYASIPRRKRALPIYGEGDDAGKYYRCWKCGFINNIDRAQVADTMTGGDSVEVSEHDVLSPGGTGMGDASFITLIDQSVSLMRLDSDGNIVPPYAPGSNKVTGGCALCGCMNYR